MTKLTFHLIPHTHWDREWYLPRGQFGARLVPVIDDLIDLLEREPAIPGFLLDGQTVLLEDYLRVRPEQRSRVTRLVSQGRIETGPWYVLADEQIPSGESLIRNLLLGKTDTSGLGQGMKVLYSPDAFGHPAILPLLAAEFAIGCGVAWRGIRTEQDLFRWKGPDGREIVMYHLPPDGYEIGSWLSSDPSLARATWDPVRRTLTSRAASPHIAVFVGADHHAARHDLPALRNAIAAVEPDHDVKLARLGDFMQAVRTTGDLPLMAGELRQDGYTWTLQGVHGTRAHQKRRNSRVELWLERHAEPLAALVMGAGGRDNRPRLNLAWRVLVQSHFHDAIGGCCADAVAREVEVRQEEVEGIVREVVQECLQDLFAWNPDLARDQPADVRPSLLLWNPAARRREGITLAQVTRFRSDVLVGPPGNRVPRIGDEDGPFALQTSTGEVIPVQVLGREPALERLDAARHYPDQDEVDLIRIAFEAPPVGGLGGEILSLLPGEQIPVWGGAEASGRRISNEHLGIEVAGDGTLTILDRTSGERRVGVLRLESETDLGDTYTFSSALPLRTSVARGPVEVRTLASGPLVAALEITGRVDVPPGYSGRSNGQVETALLVMLFRDDPLIRCTLRLTNQAVDHRLRFRVPTGAAGRAVVAGAQFGSEVRRAVTDRPHVKETPVSTAPAHRFVGLSGTSGSALFAPGFFEYELEAGGDLLFTLLRSVGQLSRNDLPTRPGHAGWPTATPLAQCLGADTVDFGLAMGGGEWGDPARLERAWEDLFLPLKARWIRNWNGSEVPNLGIELDGDGLVVSTVKPATEGKGTVLRCYNSKDVQAEGTWRFAGKINRARMARADETAGDPLPLAEGGHAVRFRVGARALVTVLVE